MAEKTDAQIAVEIAQLEKRIRQLEKRRGEMLTITFNLLLPTP